ncbi:MAG: hypothetical protein ABIS91_06740 [Nocardioides sp.]|uniref:hypothetical protein n=1 Tax=Nocardioides sp. TaxID=35761 RepID=UPI0032650A7F
MFGRKRTPQASRCWYSCAVDLPGITAEQVWELVTPAVQPLRITRLERPYVAEGFAHRADPANGSVFDIGTPPGGARLTTHVWRDLPEDSPFLALTEVLGDELPHGMAFRLEARHGARCSR